jgi:hypothetical protein
MHPQVSVSRHEQTTVASPYRAPAAPRALPEGLLTALLGLVTVTAWLPFLGRILWTVIPGGERVLVRLVGLNQRTLESVLVVVTVVAVAVFLYDSVRRLRAAGVPTKYSPALSAASFFIPIVNVVLPALAVADAWRRTTGRDARIVTRWWLLHIGVLLLRVRFDFGPRPLPLDPGVNLLAGVLGWTLVLVHVFAFVLLFNIIYPMARPRTA